MTFDPEYAAPSPGVALLGATTMVRRCNDPACTGCSPKTLSLCALVTSPPVPASPPAPVAPAFVPVPEPVFLARIDVEKRTEAYGPEELWKLLGCNVHDSFTASRDFNAQASDVAALIRDLNEALGVRIPEPTPDPDDAEEGDS